MNLDEARRFLELLDDAASFFTFQLATDDPAAKKAYPKGADGRPKDRLAQVVHLPPENLALLEKRNRAGAAVWVCINETDGKGREASNVARCRAVFIDGDGQTTLDQLLGLDLEPHIITETSPGHYQGFWLVDGLDLDQAEGVQRKLARTFGTDTICDRCRVMRVPGFLHQKDPASPHLVRIVHERPGLPYKPADILRTWPPLHDAGSKPNGHADKSPLPPPLDQERVDEIRSQHPDPFDLGRYDRDESRRDLALASLARRLGMSKEDAAALIRAVRNDGKEDRADYVWRTVHKAFTDDTDPGTQAYEQQKAFVRVFRQTEAPDGKVTYPGVYLAYEEKDNETGEKVTRWAWICSPLDIVADTRSAINEAWGRLVIVHDRDGRLHEWPLPMEMMAGSGEVYRAKLLDLGVRLSPGSFGRTRLSEYVQLWLPKAKARCVDRVGWHGPVFVLPDQTYGPTGKERVLLQTTGTVPVFNLAGSLEGWQSEVAAPATRNTRLVFAISAAFAGPLLYLLSEESGGFHLRGASSIGKTSAIDAASSVWGRPTDSWRTTDNAAEGLARGSSDTLLCLDEISQADGRAVDAIAYMLGNGSGKARMRRDATARPVITWRAMFLSTGEKSLADKLAEAGRRAQAGQSVRVLEIPADAGKRLGAFEDLHGATDGDAFARRLKLGTETHKGHAGRAFLENVTGYRDAVATNAAAARRAWVATHLPKDADGQVARAAGRFGLVAAAGELAAEMDLVPWPKGEADRAAAACFRAWLTHRGGAGPAEIRDGIAQVRAFLEAHGSSRFEPAWLKQEHWPGASPETIDAARKTINRAGFRRADATDAYGDPVWTHFVLPEAWRAEVCKGFDPVAIANAMAERGWLERGDGKNLMKKVRVPGMGENRLYVVRAAFLEGQADA